MAQLAIIFGAGASYDFLATYLPGTDDSLKRDRIPLANQLFENRPYFHAGGFTNFIVTDDVKIFVCRGEDVV